MRSWKMMALFLPCWAALLTGCSSPSAPELRVVPLELPAVLLACEPEPLPPAPDPAVPGGYLASDVAVYLIDVLHAGADCRGKLAAIRYLQVDRLRDEKG